MKRLEIFRRNPIDTHKKVNYRNRYIEIYIYLGVGIIIIVLAQKIYNVSTFKITLL